VVAQYDPPVHAVHEEDPVEAMKVPAAQLEHADDEAKEKVPVAHIPVTAVRPVVAQYDPPGQAVHAVDPVEAR